MILSPLQRFFRLLQADKKEIRQIYAFAIFSGLISLTLPLGIQSIINLIQAGRMSTSWIILLLVVVAGVALTGLFQYMQMRIIENLQQKLFTRAAFEFAYRIPRIRLEAIYRQYAPELMNRFFDTLSVQKGLSKILIDFSTAAIYIIFGLLVLSFYHPVFIAFSFALLLLVYLIFRFTARKGLETSMRESKFKYRVAHWLEEIAHSKDTFKLSGNPDFVLKQTDTETGGYLEARESHFRILRIQYLMLVVFRILVVSGLLVTGGLLVLNNKMNIGQFVAAEIIVLLIASAVEKLILCLENIYDVLTALEKMGQVTDMELEADSGGLYQELNPGGKSVHIAIDDLTFTYPDYERNILDKVNVQFSHGEKVCIAGGNGSGKSTLLYLVAGLYKVKTGSICFNGLPMGNYNLASLRQSIGNGLSQARIFEGTLQDNISLGREEVGIPEIMKAIENCGLQQFLREQPLGLNTMLGAEGQHLSKSTIQKILLARAIVNSPCLLLLENGLEHLELNERRKIIRYLTAPERPWTLLAVSSDTIMAEHCNRLIIMKNGNIEADGTFQTLKDRLNNK
jgi:ABC-type bacteriocin/lantibiotic exporter with double-glycine peptidase domain